MDKLARTAGSTLLIYFCPDCRQVVRGQSMKCPACRRELTAKPQAAHEGKLISELEDTVKGTRLLAIELLGRLKSRKAVPRLRAILEAETDPHILRECIKSLAAIDADQCRAALRKARRHHSSFLSKLARQYLEKR